MKQLISGLLVMTAVLSLSALAQVKNVSGARNTATDGTTLDTNVSFSLRMTLAGNDTPVGEAFPGDTVSISAVINPEAGDIGQPADIIIVDYLPPKLSMRDTSGNFVSWNGSLRTLVPFAENVSLEDGLDVEVFNGQLGAVGDHRIFVGYLVDEQLYFTPTALRIDIREEVVEVSAREQAIALFNSSISDSIVQGICVTCHRQGGSAQFQSAQHLFVFQSDPDHLSRNFLEFEELHDAVGRQWILSKVQGQSGHGGGAVINNGSSNFNNLSNFLELLDQAANE